MSNLKDVKFYSLSKEMSSDYIDFFENRAFSDGNINKGCYCVWHHWTDKHENERNLLPKEERSCCKRNYAVELIENGKLNGFVAYRGSQIVGFCNADLKDHYFRLSKENSPESWVGLCQTDKILAIVCFVVDPDMRGKGIATEFLQYACAYAIEKGFDYIESYPSVGKFDPYQCCGSVSMYIKSGFEIIPTLSGVIARKRVTRAALS